MKEMKIIYKNVDEIIPYENNPRINDNAVDYVANSIKEFGFKNPIIIDKDNIIVAGHTRLKAALQLEMKKVPCIMADDLTEEQIKAFRIADNRVAEFSSWDNEKLTMELQNIELDMSEFGFELEFDSFEDINDEELEEPTRFEHKMKIDKQEIYLTDEEYENIMKLLDSYTEKNGVSFGFASYLVGDKLG